MKTKKIKITLLSILSLAVLLCSAFALFSGLNKKATPAYAEEEFTNQGNVKLTLTDGIVVNYYLQLDGQEQAPVATFTGNAQTIGTRAVTGVEENGAWKFVYKAITPQYMYEDFSIQIGDTYYVKDYSVADYCQAIKEDNTLYDSQYEMDNTVALVNDLLYYGEMAKAYLDSAYTPKAEVVAGTEYDANNADGMRLSATTSVNGNQFTEAKVVFDYLPALRFYLTANTDVTVKINGEEVPLTQVEDNKYEVTYRHIYAVDFGTQVTVELQENGATVQRLSYSINDYVARITKKGSASQAMIDLAKAFYCYGESAKTVYELPSYLCNGDGTHQVKLPVDSLLDDYSQNAIDMGTLSLAVETEAQWAKIQDTVFIRGLTTDGAYIYGVSTSYDPTTKASVIRYNPETKEVAVSKIYTWSSSADSISEKTAGITYYNGQLIIYPQTGSPLAIPANFDDTTEFTTFTGFDGFNLTGITDVVYNQETGKFAVKTQADAGKVLVYNGAMQKETEFAVSSGRISASDKYIYAMTTSGSITAYDWSGETATKVAPQHDSVADTNVQSVLYFNGSLYYTRIGWGSHTYASHYTILKTADIFAVTDCESSYIDYGDYYANYDATAATTINSVEIGWTEHTLPEGQYVRGMASDGKYIYSVAFSGESARIMRYNPATQKMVYSKLFTATLKQNTAGITYYDGKLIIYPTDGQPMYIPANFDKTTELATYTGFDAFKLDGKVITDVSYNASLDRYAVQYTTTENVAGTSNGNKTTILYNGSKEQLVEFGNASTLRMTADSTYIYMMKSDDHSAMSLSLYTWDGATVVTNSKTVVNYTGDDFGLADFASTNCQGLVSHNGMIYYSTITWSGTYSGKYTLLKTKARAYYAPSFKEYFEQTGSQLTLETTQEKALENFGGDGGEHFVRGFTTDGVYLYGVGLGFDGATGVRILKYNPKTNTNVATSKTLNFASKEENVCEATAGITYYDGKIIIYTKDGKMKSISANFDNATEFEDFTAFDAFGLANITDVYYDETIEQFAVKTSDKVTVFNKDMQKVTEFAVSGVRMSGDSNYVYVSNNSQTPTVTVYDWTGKNCGSINVPNSAALMGTEKLNGVNTQGIVVANGVLYTSVIQYNAPMGFALLKTQVKAPTTGEFAIGDCYYCGVKS